MAMMMMMEQPMKTVLRSEVVLLLVVVQILHPLERRRWPFYIAVIIRSTFNYILCLH